MLKEVKKQMVPFNWDQLKGYIMGNALFTITVGFILYFLYGSLVFWSVGATLTVAFIALMFIDISEPKQRFEEYSENMVNRLDKALF